MRDEEDLGEAGLLRAQGGEEVATPLLVLAPEDLIEDQKGALMHLVELGKVAGEGDSQGNRDVVLLAAAETVDRVILVHVPHKEVEVLVKEHLLVPPAGDFADNVAHFAFEPAPDHLHEVDHVLGDECPGQSQEIDLVFECCSLMLYVGDLLFGFFVLCDLLFREAEVLGRVCNNNLLVPQGSVGACDCGFQPGGFGRIECSRFDFPGELYEFCIPLRNLSREISECFFAMMPCPIFFPSSVKRSCTFWTSAASRSQAWHVSSL